MIKFSRLKFFLWMAGFLAFAAADFFFLVMPALSRRARAMEEHEVAITAYESQRDLQEGLDGELSNLRTQVSSVELGARREYRLIMPGERLEIIEYGSGSAE